MLPVFLIGGGGDHPENAETYGRFLHAATKEGRRRVALVAAAGEPGEAEATYDYARAIFANLGAGGRGGSRTAPTFVGLLLSADTPLTADRLAASQPTGVFVCGGVTPLYRQALCEDLAWLDYLRAEGIPYGGVSAGAAIAAAKAIVGGWQARRGERMRAILYQGASEGRDLLDVRPGLGLVPFAVEVHASQWGTLTRLLHAMDLGMVEEGWAIDEDTLLQVDADGPRVYGAGHAYHLLRDPDGSTRVKVYFAPELVSPEG